MSKKVQVVTPNGASDSYKADDLSIANEHLFVGQHRGARVEVVAIYAPGNWALATISTVEDAKEQAGE